jgi:type IX secretion system PorP/SprF family membrane protein
MNFPTTYGEVITFTKYKVSNDKMSYCFSSSTSIKNLTMKYLQKYIFFIFLTVFSTDLSAQDAVFSQFYAAPFQINPALTGLSSAPRFGAHYRNQWGFFNQAYVTYATTYDQFFSDLNSGFGVAVQADNQGQGLLKTNNLLGLYSYQLNFNDQFMARFGVEAGILNKALGWDKLIFTDQIDPNQGAINEGREPTPAHLSQTKLDLGAGMVLFTELFHVGMAVKHANAPDIRFTRIESELTTGTPLRLTLHGGADITLESGSRNRAGSFVSPNIIYTRQGNSAQLNVGAYLSADLIWAGAWYRHAKGNSDAAIISMGVSKDAVKIGYSYDFTISGLAGRTGGSHELSLVLNFDKLDNNIRRKGANNMNDCFKMFR